MRKIVAAINLTIDGFCDHTGMQPDEEVHDHYTGLLNNAGTILYGRTTYQLMQYWQTFLKEPSDEKSMNDFAMAIDKIPKIVFSHTLKDTGWDSATLSDQSLQEKVAALKQSQEQGNKDILVGSRSLIIQLMQLDLIDEYQLCYHPVIAAGGLPLFAQTGNRMVLQLINTKTFNGGAVILYYRSPSSNQ